MASYVHPARPDVTTLPKVLIAEDDEAIRAMLLAALRGHPVDVHAAADGLEALQLSMVNEYAIIVLDLMMPRLSGFDFLDAYRKALPRSRSVIFVVTAFDDQVIGTLAADQVHAVIRKPFDLEQIVMLIRESALAWIDATAESEMALEPLDVPRESSSRGTQNVC